MSLGPGRYGEICGVMRASLAAEGVILIVINGALGSGFDISMMAERESESTRKVVAALKFMLPTLEADVARLEKEGR